MAGQTDVSYSTLLDLVRTRRSTREFKPDPLPEDYIEKIIEVARWAPSASNSQPWEFIIVQNKDKEIKDEIVELFKEAADFSRRIELAREEELRYPSIVAPPEQPGFGNAPLLIVLCGDSRTSISYPLLPFYSNRDALYYSSLANVALYFHLAATSLGLGSQWISASSYPYMHPHLKRLLNIPEELDVYDMFAFGYPAHEPTARHVKTKEELVHLGLYDRSRFKTATEVRDFVLSLRRWRAKDFLKQTKRT
jgi:nitroreductase